MAKKSHWNYRLLAYKDHDEVFFRLHEVYYTNGKPDGYSQDGATIGGNSMEEINKVIKLMSADVKKVIYWAGDRFPEKYKA